MSGAATSPLQEAQLGRFMGMDMLTLDLPQHTVGSLLQAGSGDVSFAINASGGLTEGTDTIDLDSGPGSGTRCCSWRYHPHHLCGRS